MAINRHAYFTAIKLIGDLLVRNGMHLEPGYGSNPDGGTWSAEAQGIFADALREFAYYHRGKLPTREEWELLVRAGEKRKPGRPPKGGQEQDNASKAVA